MSNVRWKCTCGTENTGNFCSSCGKTMGAESSNAEGSEKYSEEYLKLQIKQQELLNAQEEKRMAMEAEKNKKRREYETKLREYNQKVNEVSPALLKNWAGSWIVLVLSICASVAAACSLISLCTNLTTGYFNIIVNIVKLILSSVVCAGFWKSFAMGKRKDPNIDSRSIKMLSGVAKFYQVMAYIAAILIIVLFIVVFAGIKSCTDKVTDAAGSAGADMSELNGAITGTLVGILIALIAAFVVIIIFFTTVNRFSKSVISAFNTKVIPATSAGALAVFFFIVGGIILIGAIIPVAATSVLNEVLSSMGDVGDYIKSAGIFSKADYADMCSQFANAGMFIFGGILALTFSRLSDEALKQKKAIEKPQME